MLKTVVFQIDGIFNPFSIDNILHENKKISMFLPAIIENLYSHGLNIYMISSLPIAQIHRYIELHQIKSFIFDYASLEEYQFADTMIKRWNITLEDCIGLLPSDRSISLLKELNLPTIGYINTFYPLDTLSNSTLLLEGFDEVDYDFIEYVYNYFHGFPQVICRTKRLLIRELMVEDVDQLYPIANHESVKNNIEDMTGTLMEEKEKMSSYIKYVYNFYGIGLWGIFLSDTHELIGRGGIEFKQIDETNAYELGIYIVPQHHDKGYGIESIHGILHHCFINLELPSIVAFVEPFNINSIKLLNKIGMKYEGLGHRYNKSVQKYMIYNPSILDKETSHGNRT